MSGNGKRLCVAGTMSDYAAIVYRKTLQAQAVRRGEKPYWSTTSADGSAATSPGAAPTGSRSSPSDRRKEIARIPVGDHPQRIRTGFVRKTFTGTP